MSKNTARNTENLKPAWKKGESGNPNGRPPGTKNRSTIYKDILGITTKAKNPLTGKMELLSIEEQMALAMIQQVLEKGSVQAWNSINDNFYGKQKETIEQSSKIEALDITPEQRREVIKRILRQR